MRTRARFGLLLTLLLASAVSCAPARQPPATGAAAATLRASVSDRLYFGRSIPGGGTISDEEWSAFLRDVITPRFPAGLTVWRAEGQWRDGAGTIVREDSYVLELVHAADAASDRAIREITDAYKERFRQDAVLRVRSRIRVSYRRAGRERRGTSRPPAPAAESTPRGSSIADEVARPQRQDS